MIWARKMSYANIFYFIGDDGEMAALGLAESQNC